MADELLGLADGALAPLRARHARELAGLEEQAEATGVAGDPGPRGRWRTGTSGRSGACGPTTCAWAWPRLADAYRDRLVATVGAEAPAGSPGVGAERRDAAAHVEAIGRAAAALVRNVREDLLLEALLVELSGMLE